MTTEQKLAEAIRIARNNAPTLTGLDAEDLARIAIATLAESSGEAGPEPASPLPWTVSSGAAPYAHDRYIEQANGDAVPLRPPSDVGAKNAAFVVHAANNYGSALATIGALRAEVARLSLANATGLHPEALDALHATERERDTLAAQLAAAEATRDSLYDALDLAYRRHDEELKLLDPNGERVAEVMRLRQTADPAEDKAFPAWARNPKVRAAVEAFLAMPASERAAHIKLTFAPVYPILMALHVALLPSPEEARDGQE